MFNPQIPFDDLPKLPPHLDIETSEVMRSCVAASRALGELKGLLESIPDQRVLLELLPLQESRSSSELENIISSRDRLFMASSTIDDSDIYTREILRYNSAMVKYNRKIPDTKTIRNVCSEVCGMDVRYRSTPEDEVYLKRMGSVEYTPPSGDLVPQLMSNLMEYIFTDDEVDPLIKMAVIHYQFEAIHPFFDGNGRTGRILNVMYLQYNHLLNEPVLFLSGFIIDNRKRYYELLRRVSSDSDWEPWILFMLEAVRKTSHDTIRLIRNILKKMDDAKNVCSGLKIPLEVVDFIFATPFSTPSQIQSALSLSRPTAMKYLNQLESVNILSSRKTGRKHLFVNDGLLSLFKE
ncbi:MAG: Fic family protein [Candidatus Methanomethylophilaceae archaeon]|nr:Fic family protein [Candidatus Methanomethylophilaceae archaeon]